MDMTTFNNNFWNNPLKKIIQEQKIVLLLAAIYESTFPQLLSSPKNSIFDWVFKLNLGGAKWYNTIYQFFPYFLHMTAVFIEVSVLQEGLIQKAYELLWQLHCQ